MAERATPHRWPIGPYGTQPRDATPSRYRVLAALVARAFAPAGPAAAIAAAGIALALAVPARAAGPSADAADAASSSGTEAALDDIVVTARRRDEKMIDVPLAVTVETGEQLKEQDAALFDDVAREVPNLRMMPSPQSVSAMDVTMRGQTSIRAAIDYDPAVGIYVDGVYVANGQAAMSTLLDIDTVEIVRGAQGTLFGRDNTGGSISFKTNRPQLGVTSAEVASDTGNDRQFMGRGIVNIPLGDTLAVRAAFQDNQRDGFGSSVASGQNDFENQNRSQARIGALWKPNADFNAYATYEHFQADEAGALLHPLPGTEVDQLGQGIAQLQAIPQLAQQFPQLAGLAPVVIPSSIYQTDAEFPSHDRTYLDAGQLTMEAALDVRLHAKLILGYRHLHNDTAIDVDATSLPFADTQLANSSSQKSAEYQLSGVTMDNRLDWVAGLYWFRDDGGAPSYVPVTPAAYASILQFIGGPVTTYPVTESNSIENVSTAAFFHADYHVDDRWAVSAGLRHTDDTRKLEENSYAQTPAGERCTITGTSALAPCPPLDKSASFGYWSWELSTRYRISDGLSTYFRTGRAQRSGGWNVPLNTPQDAPFRPEELTDYELGAKSELLGGRMSINGDVFYGNYDNMQRLLPRQVGRTFTTFVINAGRARVSGAELEAAFHLTHSWTVDADLGYTDARYREFLYSPGPGQPQEDLSGNRFNQTPKLNAGLGVGYETPLAGGRARVHADYSWQDAIQFNVINDFNKQGAYGTLNARASYAIGYHGSWEIAAFATNVTGREYAITGGSILAPPSTVPAVSWQIPGTPRLYGLGFTYRFGPGY